MTSDTTSDTSAAGSPPADANPNPKPSKGDDKADTPKAGKKRSDSTAAADDAAPNKVTKRRAARACVSCRARKVRCNVVEESPCTNCRFDNIECIVQESRRRKKHLLTANLGSQGHHQTASATNGTAGSSSAATNGHNHPVPIHSAADLRRPSSGSAMSASDIDTAMQQHGGGGEGHMPHLLYQRTGYRTLESAGDPSSRHRPQHSPWQAAGGGSGSSNSSSNGGGGGGGGGNNAFGFLSGSSAHSRTAQFLNSLEEPDVSSHLPPFVRPLPARIAAEDVSYLHVKGALSLPPIPLQNALLQSYIECVHPYMPLMDLHDFLGVVNRRDGLNGQTSLFLYQAVMFSATAFVDMDYLREAGYSTRKAARKAFFQKTRLLYDFDYEMDRLVLVQGLLLMTYWYETPDDQKDTWHWMGVAISLAHTIGLHRNPGSTTMAASKQKLWKRIWWSCFMRDRLIALGMRRPTRIKDEDFDVPMLEESDFELQPLADNVNVVPPECTLMRDVAMQTELAAMCIAKARLCVCISHMLKAQYSVLIRDSMKPENTTNSTMMLFPNKQLDNVESVQPVDVELMAWAESLPASCRYRPLSPADVSDGRATVAVHRTLLHMVYYTTISALHRPQFLPSSPSQAPTTSRQVQEVSRLRVRDAAMHITRMASELHRLRLERFLPTTGVTVILPAMIIHLLEMKNPAPEARERATRGFRQCMHVMEKLRDVYAAADYATGFLDAALRKASINVGSNVAPIAQALVKRNPVEFSAHTPPPENVPYMTPSETLFNERLPASSSSSAAAAAAAATASALRRGSFASPSPAELRKAMAPPSTISAADLDLSATGGTPPPPPQHQQQQQQQQHQQPQQHQKGQQHLDFGSIDVVTPSASGGSDGAGAGADPEAMDLDFMQGHDEFDWNAVAGTDFDVDQWLQFPPEGVRAGGEDLVAGGVFGAGAAGTAGGEDATMTTTAQGIWG